MILIQNDLFMYVCLCDIVCVCVDKLIDIYVCRAYNKGEISEQIILKYFFQYSS